MNVLEYYIEQLGSDLMTDADSATLKTMPLEAPCGQHCKRAIDAAKGLCDALRQAAGDDTVQGYTVLDIVTDVCATYIAG